MLLFQTLADGSVASYTYTPNGALASVTDTGSDGELRTLSRDLDAAGHLLAEHAPDGTTTSYAYDASGNLVTATSATDSVTTYTYDARGNLASVTDPLGRVTTFVHDTGNRLTSMTAPGGATTTYQWDAADRLVSTTDALGGVTSYTYDGNDHVVSMTDPAGGVTYYTWDRLARLVSSTTPDGATTTYAYDREDNLVATTDPLGATTTYALDAAHRATSVTDPLGGVWSVALDPMGRALSATDPLGASTSYTYDELGRVLTETGPTGAVSTVTYDEAGLMTSMVNPDGAEMAYEYDLMGRVVAVTDPLGSVAKVTYALDGRVVSSVDRTGQVSTVEYDAAGNPVSSSDAAGNQTLYSYDDAGNLSSVTDANGAVTEFEYDLLGRTVGSTDALGATASTTFDPVGNVLETVDPLGAVTAFTYDAMNRPVSMTDALGATALVGWDGAGRQISSTDALGKVTAYSYDAAGQLVSVVDNVVADAAGGVDVDAATDVNVSTAYEYDAAGNLVGVTDPNGALTGYEYSPAGLLTGETTPLGARWAYGYSAAGLLTTEVAPDGVVTAYGHDGNGDVTSVDYGGQTRASFTYDKNQNPITMVDPTGTTGWAYDELGRQTEQVSPGGERLTTTYTATGQQASVTLPDGSVVGYTYDKVGNPVEQTSPQGNLSYTYDAAYNLLQIDRSGAEGAGLSTVFERDELGRVTLVAHGALADAKAAPGPDLAPVAPLAAGAVDCLPAVSYLAARKLPGANAKVVDENSVTVAYTYDAVGNVTGRDRTNGTLASESGEYTYDGVGRLSGSATTFETLPVVGVPVARSAVNDSTGLMAPAGLVGGLGYLVPGVPVAEPVASTVVAKYAYDRAGNRVSAATVAPSGTSVLSAVFGAGNQLVSTSTVTTLGAPGVVPSLSAAASATSVSSSYAYDVNGQRTGQATTAVVPEVNGVAGRTQSSATEFAYGANRKVASISDGDRSVAFTYDGLGRARTQTVATVSGEHTATNVWDGLSIVRSSDDAFGATNYVRDVTGALASQQTTGGVDGRALWSLTDVSGSVIAQAQAGEIAELSDYDDWGNQDFASAGWSSGFNFTGEVTDPALGVNLYYARTYDPATAVFTSLDPVRGLLDAPQSLNRYGYVLNNPMSAVDLYGYWPDWISDAWDATTSAVSKGWNASTKWVGENWQGLVVGAVVGTAVAACLVSVVCGMGAVGTFAASSVGAGLVTSVGVGAVSGGAASLASYGVTNRGNYSWEGAGNALASGATFGAAFGPVGYGVSQGLRAIGSKLSLLHPSRNSLTTTSGSWSATSSNIRNAKLTFIPKASHPDWGRPPTISTGALNKHVPGTNEWVTATNRARAYDIQRATMGSGVAAAPPTKTQMFKSMFFGSNSATRITQMTVNRGSWIAYNKKVWTSPVAIGYSTTGVPLYRVVAVKSSRGWHGYPTE